MTGRPPSCVCGTCKKCKRAAYMREWYRRTSAERGRPATGNRDPEVAIRSDEKRRGTPLRAASQASSTRRMRAKYPEKYRARNKTYAALKSGALVRKPCVVCGAEKVDAHHPDYSKPLEVIWVCRRHHVELHR